MRKCPKCGSPRIHRSRSRGLIEQLRKSLTQHRPHRCHACGWRGWGEESQPMAEPEGPARRRGTPDFDAIDVALAPGRAEESRQAASNR